MPPAQAKNRRADIAEAMVDEDVVVDSVNVKGKLITLTYTEALQYRISDGTVQTKEQVVERLGKKGAKIEFYQTKLGRGTGQVSHSTPLVSSLLLSIGFLGLILEVKTPGWGIGGTIALIALALFFGSHYIVKLAGIGEILLFAAGVSLLAVEIFVIPGFGIPGIAGIGLIVISIYLSLIGKIPHPGEILHAGYTIAGALLITIVGTTLLIKFLPKTPAYKKLTLSKNLDGYVSSVEKTELYGQTGIAESVLRPAGIAMIGDKRYDVVTEGDFIEKGVAIHVIKVQGARIVVERAPEETV